MTVSHVMLDLETMGTRSDAAIVAIGAVRFNFDNESTEPFYVNVNLQSCINAGLRVDGSTIMWWMQQSDDARAMFDRTDDADLYEALSQFNHFYDPGDCLWSNGANFDPVVLENAYRAVERRVPWKFYDVRCVRTICALAEAMGYERPVFEGTPHNAIDDCMYQITYLKEALAYGRK